MLSCSKSSSKLCYLIFETLSVGKSRESGESEHMSISFVTTSQKPSVLKTQRRVE